MRHVSPEEGDGGVHAAERVGAHGQLGLRGQVGRVLRGAAAARQPEDAAHAETSWYYLWNIFTSTEYIR